MQQHKRTPAVWEVFEKANTLSGPEQIAFFKSNAYPAVQQICQLAFNGFEFLVPTETPPLFTPANEESAPSSLHRQFQRLAMIVKGSGFDNLNQFKRESFYVQLLEGLPPQEAELVISVVMGNFKEKYPAISQASAAAAFPKAVKAPQGQPAPTPAPEPIVEEITDLHIGESLSTFSVNTEEPIILQNAGDKTMHLRGTVDVDWDFSEMAEESFNELRRAVMRENHARTQAKKKA